MEEPITNLEFAPDESGWRKASASPSLPEAFRSVPVYKRAGFWRKLLTFSGPGYLVAVGYMDPGNWATDLAGGSKFGYQLLSVIMISNLMAILLQHLCAKLGIVTGRDLAQACRDHYTKPVSAALWVLCELAICACDLAEVLGSAIALQLLFHIPLTVGVCVTALDVLVLLALQNKGFRYLETLVISLIVVIGSCFALELLFAKPELSKVLWGFFPSPQIITNKEMLYLAIGILGATVMPHNLYLHSSIVQTRKYDQNDEGRAEAIQFATIDSTVALMFALFINAAILILAAAAFHFKGNQDVADIDQAYELLSPMLGVTGAGVLFAVALLASGQNSTITGTLAGQIVMEGFLNIRLKPWLRRLITRLIAIVPAVIVSFLYGREGTGKLLVFSQVFLSLQLPFAVIPLIIFVGERKKMGRFRPRNWVLALAWITAGIIVTLNIKYLFDLVMESFTERRMYSKILMALDATAADRSLMSHIVELAKLHHSRLLLVHVADGWAARNFDALKLAESEEMKKDKAYLEQCATELRSQGLEVQTHLALGNPPTEILKTAAAEHCDLIAMTSHGHRFVADVVLGSTIEAVRHRTHIPLLIVRAE